VRRAGDTRAAIIAAAATEFAAHGFAGASVDAIAARSRFNKAMIYYHFESKQGLYVEILRDVFRRVGAATGAIADAPLAPAAKIEAFIDAFDQMAATHPYMPPMMMREMAEGAVRLDAGTLRLMARIFGNLRRILEEGAGLGAFRPADPILTYFTLVTPVIFFRASAPVRDALGRQGIVDVGAIDAPAFIRRLKANILTVLTAAPSAPPRAAAKAAAGTKPGATRTRPRRSRSTRPGDRA
jgi:AcrR family transcriptional regulator